MTKLYSTTATVTGGREGKGSLSDSDLSFDFVPAGSNKKGTNPEQLFASGYAACFGGALNAVQAAENSKFDNDVQITIELNKGGDLDFYLSGEIHVVARNTDLTAEQVQAIIEKAHQVCPYSRATKGNIEMKVTSEIQA